MFQWLKDAVQKDFTPVNAKTTQVPPAEISASLQENLIYLRGVFGPSFDLMVRELPVNGNRAAFVLCEGMCNDLLLSQIAVTPILHATDIPKDPNEQFLYLRDHVLSGTDHKEAFDTIRDGCRSSSPLPRHHRVSCGYCRPVPDRSLPLPFFLLLRGSLPLPCKCPRRRILPLLHILPYSYNWVVDC